MNAQKKWVAAGVAVLVAAAIAIAVRSGGEKTAAAEAARSAGPARQAGESAGSARPGSPAAPVAVRPVPGAPPPDAPRVMPYRPAKYLYYSEERPAREPSEDFDQPALKKILEVTQADATQQGKIRELWRSHEDARRVLWAKAPPRFSGPRMLDPEKLEELDSDFETAVFGVLQPAQKASLSQELPPPGASRAPPAKMYADPRLEK